MKKNALVIVLFYIVLTGFQVPEGSSIIRKVDQNLSSSNRVMETTIVIHGKRNSRTITSKIYAEGDEKSYTEYLSPAREQGTKMLKLQDQLWIYSPSTDRTIQIAGHMLRQSVMGSDLSYEDMMDDRPLLDVYTAEVAGVETIAGRQAYVIELQAKVQDVAYHRQRMWVDTERFVPLKQEMYAKGGQLLKQVEFQDVRQVQGRWFPMVMIYKDMLKEGKGTEFRITDIAFNVDIPEHMFTKGVLRR